MSQRTECNYGSAENFSWLSVIIPAHNEEDSISYVLQSCQKNLTGCQLIVVDDASTDSTAEKAKAFEQVNLLQLPYNHGYGGALKKGISTAGGKYIAWLDADGEHKIEDLHKMALKVANERLGAVLGERSHSVSRYRGMGKFSIRILATLLGLGYIADFNCGLRIFQREVLLSILFLLPDSYSASTTSTFLLAKLSIPHQYFPISTDKRIGESKVRLRDGLRTLFSIFRTASLLAPLRLFGMPSFAFFVTGITYSAIIVMINKQGVPALGVLLVATSLILVSMGLLADQIGQLRIQHARSIFFSVHPVKSEGKK